MNTNDRTEGTFIPDPSCFEITDEKFKELFDSYRKMIEETSIGLATGVPPSISLHFRQLKDGMPGDVESALIVIDEDFNDGDTKRRAMEAIGAKCFEKKWILVAVCMASEAWMSTRTKEKPDFDVLPSQDPNRKESIMVAGRTLLGECKMGYMMPVSRDKDNKFIKDGEVLITSEIDTYLLDHVFIGFRKALAKYLGHK